MVEHLPFKQGVESSILSGLTKREKEGSQVGVLTTPLPVTIAMKLESKSAESHRKKNKEKRKNFKQLCFSVS